MNQSMNTNHYTPPSCCLLVTYTIFMQHFSYPGLQNASQLQKKEDKKHLTSYLN